MNVSDQIQEIDIEKEHDLSLLFDLVAYHDIDEHFGYWNARNRDFVTFIRFDGIDQSVLSEHLMEQISKAFGRSLAQLPEAVDVSLYKFTHRDIHEKINAYEATLREDDLSALIANSVIDHQIRGAVSKEGFFADVSPAIALEALNRNERENLKVRANERALHKSSPPLPRTGQHAHEVDIVIAIRFGSGKFQDLLSFVEKFKVVIGQESVEHANARHYFEVRDQFVEAVADFMKTLYSFGFSATVMTAQGLINIIYRFVNPARYYSGKVPSYNCRLNLMQTIGLEPIHSNHSVGAHVGMSTIEFIPKGMNISHDKEKTFYYRAASVATIPRIPEVDQLERWLYAIEGESLLIVNFHINTDLQRQTKILKKKANLRVQSNLMPSFMQEEDAFDKWYEDIKIYEEMTDPRDRENMQKDIDYSIHYIPYGSSEVEVEDRAKRAAYAFDGNGRYESRRGNTVIFSAIPGRFTKGQMQFIGRTFGSTTGILGHVSPIYCHYQGLRISSTTNSSVIMNNRAGTPIFLDFFVAPKTPHTLVVGGTGTGKSFSVNQIMGQLMAKARPKTWIIDRGGSFKPMANLWCGAHLDITTTPSADEEQTVINPFITYQNTSGEYIFGSNDDFGAIAAALKLMIQMIDPERRFSAIESNMLDGAIRDYMINGKPVDTEGTFSDFVAKSLKHAKLGDISGEHLAHELGAYYGEGKFAGIFDGHSTFSWDNDLIVVETQRIPTQILPLVMILLFSNIDSYAKVKLDRKRKKLMAIDEAWAALAYEELINVVAGFFREMRKYNMGIWLISQTITEFIKLATMGRGKSDTDGIFANVANYLFLPVSAIDYKAAANDLDFTDEELNAWKSLEGNPPFYSEVYYRFRNKKDAFESGIFRIYSSAVMLWAGTTNAVDVSVRDERILAIMANEGLDRPKATTKACRMLAEEMPYGSELTVTAA